MDKRFWGVIAAMILVVGGIIVFHGGNKANAPGGSSSAAATNHVEGKGTTGVKLVEYGDYQCSACGQYYPIAKATIEHFGDKITFQFRHFPLVNLHPNAFAGSRAAEAAGLQDKYWGMHDLLYTNQDVTGRTGWVASQNPLDQYFVGFAQQLGLDITKFKQDYASSKVNDAINADLAEGNKLDIKGTPTFFLNGRKITMPESAKDFITLIDKEIAAKQKK